METLRDEALNVVMLEAVQLALKNGAELQAKQGSKNNEIANLLLQSVLIEKIH